MTQTFVVLVLCLLLAGCWSAALPVSTSAFDVTQTLYGNTETVFRVVQKDNEHLVFLVQGTNFTSQLWRDSTETELGYFSMAWNPQSDVTEKGELAQCTLKAAVDYSGWSNPVFNVSAGDYSSKEMGLAYISCADQISSCEWQAMHGLEISQEIELKDKVPYNVSACSSSFCVYGMVSNFATSLSASDEKLASYDDNICFQDKRCKGEQGTVLGSLYCAYSTEFPLNLTNQNVANMRGEIFFIYNGLSGIMDAEKYDVAKIEGMVVDSRFRPYERCNPVMGEDSKEWQCERSSYYSALGAGHGSISVDPYNNWELEQFSCKSINGFDWYSLNAKGEGKTWDVSKVKVEKVKLLCLMPYLTKVFKWGNGDMPKLDMYPDLEKAFEQGWEECEKVTEIV